MKNIKTGNNFDAIIRNLKDSLEEHHKYRCGSDEHRADLVEDYGLPAIPDEESLVGKTVDGIWTNERDDRTPEQRAAMEEHDRICDLHADVEMDHNFEQSSYIAFDILELLKHSTCAHCGDTHTSHGLDDDGTAFEYEGLLLNLFEVVAYELLESGANLKYSLGEKQRLLDIVTRLNPPKNVEAA